MKMKITLSKVLILAIGLTSSVLTSCDKDDDTPTKDSSFIVDRNNLKGEIKEGVVVLEEGTYKLTGALVVGDGANLIINPGVVVEATEIAENQFGSVRYIGVAQGGKIEVRGTADRPVVMTAERQVPGSWGGLVLCGKAPINKGTTAKAEVSDLTYGGTNPDDNSGRITYLRIEYSGYSYNESKEFNGLSFFGVGRGTVVENVQVHEGSDDGFEWFGGTVNAKNLIVTNFSSVVGDDLFDWTEGWNGVGENWYGKRTNAGNRGIEADNNAENQLANPISAPTIRNLTLIGAGDLGPEPQALKLRVGTKGTFDNVVLSNWKVGFDVQHDESVDYVAQGSLKATNVRFDQVQTKSVGKRTNNDAADVSAVYTENPQATGAGAGVNKPVWANGWTVGL